MTWVRLDEAFAQHPKVVRVGPLGMALHVAALCYCNTYLTDGHLPTAAARTLIDLEDFGGSKAVIKELVNNGLWDEVADGYQLHDYHEYQPTKQQVIDLRSKKQAAGEAGGKASGEAKRKAKQKASAQAKSKPGSVPVPEPEPGSESAVENLAPAERKDHLFETVAAVCDIDYRELTPQSRGPLNTATKQLRDLDVTPDEVRYRASNWPNLFPDATLTPTALAKHWPQLARERAPAQRRDRYVEMGQSLQQRMDEVKGGNGGQSRSALDQAGRGLSA